MSEDEPWEDFLWKQLHHKPARKTPEEQAGEFLREHWLPNPDEALKEEMREVFRKLRAEADAREEQQEKEFKSETRERFRKYLEDAHRQQQAKRKAARRWLIAGVIAIVLILAIFSYWGPIVGLLAIIALLLLGILFVVENR
jgi:Flp pilus assembly protein TadB